MKNRLPVILENNSLPYEDKKDVKNYSYGFVSIVSILSLGITIGSILAVMIIGNR